MELKTLEDLLDWEDNWLDRDGLDEGVKRNAWLEGGTRRGCKISWFVLGIRKAFVLGTKAFFIS